MKRFWSRFFTVAALGCLMTVWALPASAYYPPLAAVTTATKLRSHEVACEVRDPKNGYKGNIYLFVKELVQADGVIAMVRRDKGGFVKSKTVICVTYDPFLKDFVDDFQGGYKDVYQLQVANGVVAYIAMDLEDQPAFHYATYDPVEGGWQHQKWQSWIHTTVIPKTQDMKVTTKEGIVTLYWEAETGVAGIRTTDVAADIYDGAAHDWQSKLRPDDVGFLYGGQNQFQLKKYWIQDASVHVVSGIKNTSEWDTEVIWGYDHAPGQKIWTEGPTMPMPYFAAQPSSGAKPLWVWFTDMSIGAASVNWTFGDGGTDYKRSTYHTYNNSGTYQAEQDTGGYIRIQEINVLP